MNTTLQTNGTGTLPVPHGTFAPEVPALVSLLPARQEFQPIVDVRAYLNKREPVSNCLDEEALRITLPNKAPHYVRNKTTALNKACRNVLSRVEDGESVQKACKAVLANSKDWHWNLNTFRQKFDLWRESGDWTVLVNKAKAGGGWIDRDDDLPSTFLKLCETRFGQFARIDAKRQAIISLHRQWKTGRNPHGVEEVIAGYEDVWEGRDRENIPNGWTYDNIRNQIIKRDKFTKGVRALMHEGVAAAREHLPHIIGTKSNLRFLEEVTFDDVRFDYLILNEETGFAEELWALVAREQSCRMVLGGVLYPATVREDEKGKKRKSHLGAKQMKELSGYLLQTYPLPPYVMRWIVERGTATLREAVRLALGELFDNRISVRYTSMVGGVSPVGYKEEKDGNPYGKGSHESHNHLYHTQGSFIAGQTGSHYGIRPTDLKARCEEAQQIWKNTRHLPEHLRTQVQYPLLTLRQARQKFNQFSIDQNFRTEHKIEGFDKVIEVWDGRRWVVTDIAIPGMRSRERMEMPVERAAKKIREVSHWTRPSPEIICAFLDHSQRKFKVGTNGRIQLDHEGQTLYFEHGGAPLKSGTAGLAYHNVDNPESLHLTDGDGRILGTWFQVGRVPSQDRDAISQAMRGTHAALASAQATATELAAPQLADLESMRRHNADLQNFITVTDAPQSSGELAATQIAKGLAAAGDCAKNAKPADQKFAPHVPLIDDDTDDLLKRAEAAEQQ